MKRIFVPISAFFACALMLTPLGLSSALACTSADFGAVVDQTAQALRDLNINGAKRFQAKLQSVRQKYGLSEDEIQTRAAALQDNKMSEFNREIDTLVNQMDALSQTPNDKINCEKLDELKRVRDQLLTIMALKSGYMLAKADAELDKPGGAVVATAPLPRTDDAPGPSAGGSVRTSPKSDRLDQKQPETADKGQASPTAGAARKETPPQTAPKTGADASPAPKTADAPPAPKAAADAPPAPKTGADAAPAPKTAADAPPAPKTATDAPSAPALKPALPERRTEPTRTARNWTPESQTFAPTPPALAKPDRPREESYAPPTALAPPADGQSQLPPQGSQTLDNTYSIAEIQEAGRGIFGTITAQFAGAINYAFQNFGQPNAYITGSEGGAAVLAGLRYGKGRLHVKVAPESDIYWQGPSAGIDLGAEGSNALFLVYNLDDPNRIYGRFTGIGGSAYVAGGVGLNVLGKSGMVMVPIRSGVGLRLGANLAYLKFTERQTWNPF